MKNKIDLSQESIKQFFVHHWEKMAFGVGIISIGLFAYYGMQSESYTAVTPQELDTKVNTANNYMSASKWDDISAQRVADTNAPTRLNNSWANPIDLSEYSFKSIVGEPRKSQTLRSDPLLLLPGDFEVESKWVVTPWKTPSRDLNNLPLRNPEAGPVSNSGGQSGEDKGRREGDGGRGAIGGGDGSVGSEGLGGSNASAGGEAIGGAGGGRGAGGIAGSGGSNTLPSDLLRIYHSPRPGKLNLNVNNHGPLGMNIICVKAPVPFKEQLEKYRDTFVNSIGYNKQRDIPVYTHFEVQCKEDDGEWKDVTDIVQYKIYDVLLDKTAPETVEKEYLDPALTKPIPAILGQDYRGFVKHKSIKNHVWYEPRDRVSTETKDEDVDARNLFTGSGGTEKTTETKKEEKEEADYHLLRFFYPAAKEGSTYQFRVRLWVADPNNPTLGSVDISALTSGGRGRGGLGGGAAGANGPGQNMSAGAQGIEGEGDGSVAGGQGSASATLSQNMLDPKVRNRLSTESEEWKKKMTDLKKGKSGDSASSSRPGDASDRGPGADGRDSANAGKKIDDEELMKILMVSRHTEWSEPTPAYTVKTSTSNYYAGKVEAEIDRIGDLEYTDGETTGSLVVKSRISGIDVDGAAERKTVYPGDGLNWKSIWTIIHPIDLSIRHYYEQAGDAADKDEEKEGKVVRTDAVLIDIMGGEEVRNLKTRDKQYNIPGQFLIMDDNGNFRVADEVSDQGRYRLALAKVNLEEEAKARKSDDDDEDEDDRGRGLLTGGERR